MSETLTIFKENYVDQLESDVQGGRSISDYLDADFRPPADQLHPTKHELNGDVPVLSARPSDDADSAIAVYEFLGSLSPVQASDRRLWAYLCHVTFRDYTMERWPIDEDMEWHQAAGSIVDHWFTAGTDRSLRRNSIARLWWAAHVTLSPWETDPSDFHSLKTDDAYAYTRLLLSKQDLFQNTLERSMCRSKKVLLAILDVLRRNPELAEKRDSVRGLIKETNLASGYRRFATLSFSEVNDAVTELAAMV